MRYAWLLLLLSGCASFPHVTCAPQSMVEGCLLEAWPASGEGWGTQCATLNEFAKLNGWLYGGEGGVHPPHPVQPPPKETAHEE